MSRHQRHRDSWALLYACEVTARSDSQAGRGSDIFRYMWLIISYSAEAKQTRLMSALQVKEFLGAGACQWGFLVRGLQQVEPALKALNIHST